MQRKEGRRKSLEGLRKGDIVYMRVPFEESC